MTYTYANTKDYSNATASPIVHEADQGCWHNVLAVARGTATAGTLTISYKLAGKTFALKDQYGTQVTMSLASDPDPIRFDGMVDAIVIAHTGINAGGTFTATLLGQTTN